MDNKKNDVEKALEDIFDEPFLTNEEEKELNKNELKNTEKKLYEDGEGSVKIAKYSDDTSKEDVKEEHNSHFVYPNYDENKDKKDYFSEPIVVNTEVKKSKYGMYAILSLILMFIIGTAFIIVLTNKEKIVECSYNAKDDGYKIQDTYIIAHKNGNLTYIQGEYTYTALNDEFKSQLSYVKEEKLPVIVNSNGMPGYTHILETTDEYVKIYSFYDITKIDFKVVDKNNDRTTPLSYVKLKSNTTFKKLEKDLKKQGYICEKK